VGRYRSEGELGLRDRSSAPRRIPHRTSAQRVAAIAALRRLRFTGPEIAEVLAMPLSTVSGILRRIAMCTHSQPAVWCQTPATSWRRGRLPRFAIPVIRAPAPRWIYGLLAYPTRDDGSMGVWSGG
jgi:hypothetical protein